MKPWQKRTGDEKAYQSTKSVVRKTFLILCENVLMEPYYFRSFPVRTAQVKAFGVFDSKVELVSKAREYVKKESPDRDCEVWLVLNYEEQSKGTPVNPDDFNRAVEEAEKLGYKVAWSNPSFDLWLLLHFQDAQPNLSPEDYSNLLGKYFKCDYAEFREKAGFCSRVYGLLERNGSQKAANRRATSLLSESESTPAKTKPGTSVHLLIDELNRYLKP